MYLKRFHVSVLNFLHFVLPHPRVIFQLDGAPPYWGLGVRRSLERRVFWSVDRTQPPRCSDAVPLEFFFVTM